MHKFKVSFILVMGLLLLSVGVPEDGFGQNAGRVKAMKERAEKITKMKNEYVVHVLQSYKIPYRLTPDGNVGALEMEGEWVDVKKIDIVPIAEEDKLTLNITGHEIFFYTDEQIVHLVSSLVVR